jgi:carbamoyl-phosphate synthase small subunit
VRGTVIASAVTNPSNWRSSSHLDGWLKARGIVGITGVDTRALTARIRDMGMPNAVIANDPQGQFDREALKARAAALAPMEGLDLVPPVTSRAPSEWSETVWALGNGYGKRAPGEGLKVVAIDYGVKRNILRLLAQAGCDVTVVPATTTADEILAMKPDGVFLSNGPGDPAATGAYAVPVIRKLLDEKVPTFGICLGHQLMGLALGGRTVKMGQGHHGANHPVKDKTTGKVEIVSMNHGFAVDPNSLPDSAVETHVSLFDGSNCGLTLTDRPAFSVQHHPEASPGPRDSHYLFERFVTLMRSGEPETTKGA